MQYIKEEFKVLNNHEKDENGNVKSIVYYLEMKSKPQNIQIEPPISGALVMEAHNITLSFYRFLYNTVGGPWLWTDRRKMSDNDLSNAIRTPNVHIYVLYVQGVPAGYGEIELSQDKKEAQLQYFGIMPEFIGKKLGRYLLNCVTEKAWSFGINRFWVHTCSLDHPSAVKVYKQGGFVEYKTEIEWSDGLNVIAKQ